jgi:hypothetical protein
MTRRMATHNYSRPGIYHITIHVAEGMGQPLGQIEDSPTYPDGSQNSPQMVLTPIGNMVREELLSSITDHYRMITVDTFVIMPEHLHALLIVKEPIVSRNGRPTQLGQVIAGFKKGCNRRYWAMTGQTAPTGEPLDTKPAAIPAGGSPAMVPGGSPARKRTSSNATTGRPPLFAYGYCDVQPITEEQLATQRAYIQNNPRSRWLRSHNRACLQPQRFAVNTALTPSALRGFLQRECHPKQATPDALAAIECRLLLADGKIVCDTYGNRTLLSRTLLPVVCHHKDKGRFHDQKARCLEEATYGAVLVSPRIASGEQEIMNEAVSNGFPVIIVTDNGFPERYHPSTERIDQCAKGQLLLVTPWQYQYRGKNEQVTIPFCKAMNCVAQALCLTKDDWWKKSMPSGPPAHRVPSGPPAHRVSSGPPAHRVSSGSPAGPLSLIQ